MNRPGPDPYLKDKRRIMGNFSRAASGYDERAQFQQQVCARLEERLEFIRAKPDVVVDLGSGTGVLARALRRRYAAATTLQLDITESMLRQSRPRWPWQRRRQNWVCADAESLPLASQCADLVASNLMLQWCDEPDRVLREAGRVLRPGGLLLLSTLGPTTLWELRECWSGVDEHVHVNRFLDIHALGSIFSAAGFADAVLETGEFTLTCQTCMDLMRDLHRLGTGNANLGRNPALTGKGRLGGVQRSYEKFRRDGRLPASFEVIYAHAWLGAPRKHRPGAPVSVPVSAIGRRQDNGHGT